MLTSCTNCNTQFEAPDESFGKMISCKNCSHEFRALFAIETEKKKCPNCGYTAKDQNDPLITSHGGLGECPACGIIVEKFTSQKKPQNNEKSKARPPKARPKKRKSPKKIDKDLKYVLIGVSAFFLLMFLALLADNHDAIDSDEMHKWLVTEIRESFNEDEWLKISNPIDEIYHQEKPIVLEGDPPYFSRLNLYDVSRTAKKPREINTVFWILSRKRNKLSKRLFGTTESMNMRILWPKRREYWETSVGSRMPDWSEVYYPDTNRREGTFNPTVDVAGYVNTWLRRKR